MSLINFESSWKKAAERENLRQARETILAVAEAKAEKESRLFFSLKASLNLKDPFTTPSFPVEKKLKILGCYRVSKIKLKVKGRR